MNRSLPDRLPETEWRGRPGLDRLLAALGDGQARFVGGAVRDALIGIEAKDVDLATPLPPADVVARLEAAGIKAVPTGIEHGTVTAVLNGWPVEVTTLRRDVTTDGRRATVAFTADWREDAARRDFTFNALYADPATGAIFDPFGGRADLAEGRVRFIGDAARRIAEDHLRILRYFRFLARFGCVADPEAEAACRAAAASLKALSRERIADELMKLLAAADPVTAARRMLDGGIWAAVVPEVTAGGIDRLEQLRGREAAARIAPAPVRRLAALLPPEPALGDGVAARLKLSTRARKRIVAALAPPPAPTDQPAALAYLAGLESAVDLILLDSRADLSALSVLDGWTRPSLPFGGGRLVEMGLKAGPVVARALGEVEAQWIAEGFPGGERPQAIADQVVLKLQRADQ